MPMRQLRGALHPAPIESLRSPTTVNEVLRQFADAGGNETVATAGGRRLMQAMTPRRISPEALPTLTEKPNCAGLQGRTADFGSAR